MTREEVIAFYDTHYDGIGKWPVRLGSKILLGDRSNRICRFSGLKPPAVKFSKVAHAIPEALGNKSIETEYEWDTCNELFEEGIEHDFGNWSKPMRTMACIRGKTDAASNGRLVTIPLFPMPDSPDPERFPLTQRGLLDLTGRNVVKGEVFPITIGYDVASESSSKS